MCLHCNCSFQAQRSLHRKVYEMNALNIALVISAVAATSMAGELLGGYGFGGGYGGGFGGGYGGGFGGGYGGGLGGVGIGSSVALLHSGPHFSKVVAGPAFLVKTVHHVNKLHGGGAIIAHSGLGGGYGGGYGGLGYGGYGLGYGFKG